MTATTQPIRKRFIPKIPKFPVPLKWVAAFKTQQPRRKKGFSGTIRLCRICMRKFGATVGIRNLEFRALGINSSRRYGGAAFHRCGVALFASASVAYQGEFDVRSCGPALSQRY